MPFHFYQFICIEYIQIEYIEIQGHIAHRRIIKDVQGEGSKLNDYATIIFLDLNYGVVAGYSFSASPDLFFIKGREFDLSFLKLRFAISTLTIFRNKSLTISIYSITRNK